MPDNDSNNSTNLGHKKYCDLPVSCLLAAAFNIQLWKIIYLHTIKKN